MSHAIFNCPECQRPLGLPEGMATPGEFIVCPCCDKNIQVPGTCKDYETQLPTVIRPKRKQRDRDEIPSDDESHESSPPAATETHQAEPECREDLQTGKAAGSRARSAKKILVISAAALAILTTTALCIRISIVKTCKDRIDRLVKSLESYGAVTYGDVCISAFGRGAEIRDIVVTPGESKRPVSVDCLVLKRLAFNEGVPTRMDIEAYGVHIPIYPETFGKAAVGLRGLDYHCLTSHITCGYRYDPEQNEIRINDLAIKSPTVGDCSLSLLITGADLMSDDLTRNRIVSSSRIWGIREARLEYHDDSFIPRFIAYQAQYIGETVKELNKGMLTDLDKAIEKAADPVTREFLTQFRPFVKNPKHVLISTELDGPTSVGNVLSVYDQQGAMSLIPTLKLKLTSREY